MNILVTGGSGFIGKYIVRELMKHGHDVWILSRKKIESNEYESIQGDITDFESVRKAVRGMDAVFHNAAYAADWGKKEIIYRTNVGGSENVARAAMDEGIERLIYTSSAGVYGFPDSMKKIDEESPKHPLNVYQKSKLMAEQLLFKTPLHVSAVRPPLVFGAGGHAVRVLLSSMEEGKLAYIGDGNNFVSIVHPEDVARCLYLAFRKDDEGRAFNVVSDVVRLKDFFDKLSSLMKIDAKMKRIPYPVAYMAGILNEFMSEIRNKEPKITRFRVKTFATNRIISDERARKILGYVPKYSMKEIAEDMVAWYKTQS
ncbi:MAG: NAD-dependent epimerase/dehydratase family protein [Thermoplasmata archaeon]|nr:NAD-dependent epimerase/dehydratase family protein [Thermoplasmata archaeon]